jgi:hypothetical protein
MEPYDLRHFETIGQQVRRRSLRTSSRRRFLRIDFRDPATYVWLIVFGLIVLSPVAWWGNSWLEARRRIKELKAETLMGLDQLRAELTTIVNDRKRVGKNTFSTTANRSDIDDSWQTCQAITGLLECKASGESEETKNKLSTEDANWFIDVLEARLEAKDYDSKGKLWKYGTMDFQVACPSMWFAMAVARLHILFPNPDVSQRARLTSLWNTAIKGIQKCEIEDSSTWLYFPNQKDSTHGSVYATTLALMAMLDAHDAGLRWDNADDSVRIGQTARWLESRYRKEEKGWSEYDTAITHPGLALQVIGTLLRAEEAGVGFQVGDATLAGLKPAMEFAVRFEPYALTIESHQNLAIKLPDNSLSIPAAPIRFLARPWAIQCAVLWEKRLENRNQSLALREDNLAQLKKMCVDEKELTLTKAREAEIFFAAELLIGTGSGLARTRPRH